MHQTFDKSANQWMNSCINVKCTNQNRDMQCCSAGTCFTDISYSVSKETANADCWANLLWQRKLAPAKCSSITLPKETWPDNQQFAHIHNEMYFTLLICLTWWLACCILGSNDRVFICIAQLLDLSLWCLSCHPHIRLRFSSLFSYKYGT
jgi:hypothetical protein